MSKNKVIISDIEWDWDDDLIANTLDYMSREDKETLLKTATGKDWDLSNMDDDDVWDAFSDLLHHNKLTPEQFFNLPEEIEVDEDWEDEEIGDYIGNEYGFCIKGFTKSTDPKNFE